MFTNQLKTNQQWLGKFVAFAMFGFFIITGMGYSQTETTDHKAAILQGSIHIQPSMPISNDHAIKIQPGTSVKLMVTVENKGEQTSPPGQLYVRYSFAHPLENEKTSSIFETEKKPLPPIEPGQQVEIAFDAPHQLPSLLDFVRYDWSIREYQAIAVIDHQENLIGTLALTFSAYYYPGIKKEFPTEISP